MTKVIILGEAAPKKKKKPIEFVTALKGDKTLTKSDLNPSQFGTIKLMVRNYHGSGLDLMFAFIDGREFSDSGNTLYLGHFNDGVVE